jgi:hypothetical protein
MKNRPKRNTNTVTASVHKEYNNTKRKAAPQRKNKQYSLIDLNRAVNSVLTKQLNLSQAEKKYKISRRQIARYVFLSRSTGKGEENPSAATDEAMILLNLRDIDNNRVVDVYTAVVHTGTVVISMTSRSENEDSTNNVATKFAIAIAKPVGKRTVLLPEEEKLLADFLIKCADQQTPISKRIAGARAAEILDLRGKHFNTVSGMPSRSWWNGFYSRFPHLKAIKAQTLPD